MGCHFLLPGIFLTQGSNLHLLSLLNCRPILYPLSHLGSPAEMTVQFSSVAQSCPTLCDPMNCSTPGLPVHHQLPEFTQTHVHRVGDAIQPSPPQEMATHSSILVWKIPWTDEPGGLSPWGCQESNTTEATEHSSMHFSTKLCACYILGKRRQYLINIYLTKYSSNQYGHLAASFYRWVNWQNGNNLLKVTKLSSDGAKNQIRFCSKTSLL